MSLLEVLCSPPGSACLLVIRWTQAHTCALVSARTCLHTPTHVCARRCMMPSSGGGCRDSRGGLQEHDIPEQPPSALPIHAGCAAAAAADVINREWLQRARRSQWAHHCRQHHARVRASTAIGHSCYTSQVSGCRVYWVMAPSTCCLKSIQDVLDSLSSTYPQGL